MDREYHRIVLLFVDGIGLAAPGPDNPLTTAPTPTLRQLLGGPLTRERLEETAAAAVLVALDATFGVAGLPQSATGQTALFAGVNAPRLLGRHVSAFPGPQLRRWIDRRSLFKAAGEAGLATTFANAYSSAYLAQLAAGEGRRSVTTCAVQAAGLAFRSEADLAANRAVSWDICRDLWRRRTGAEVEPVTASAAGAHLATIAERHRLTVFETFLTDLAAHARVAIGAAEAMARVDGLLGGLLATLDPRTTVVLTSDHGNLEEVSTRSHTRNPVPLLAVGPVAARFADLRSLDEVRDRILGCLGIAAGPAVSS